MPADRPPLSPVIEIPRGWRDERLRLAYARRSPLCPEGETLDEDRARLKKGLPSTACKEVAISVIWLSSGAEVLNGPRTPPNRP